MMSYNIGRKVWVIYFSEDSADPPSRWKVDGPFLIVGLLHRKGEKSFRYLLRFIKSDCIEYDYDTEYHNVYTTRSQAQRAVNWRNK